MTQQLPDSPDENSPQIAELFHLAIENTDDNDTLHGFTKVISPDAMQKAAEDHLREAEEFMRSILQSSVDCIKVLDLDGNLVSMNAPGLCIMEIDDFSDFEGRCWADFWGGQEHEYALRAVESAKRGEIGRFRGFAETAKGTRKYWDVIVSPILDQSGKPKQILSIARDITQEKYSEDALAQSKRRAENILESIGDAFYALDREWQFTYLNRQSEPLLQRKREELLGKNIWSEFPEAVGTIFYEHYHKAVTEQVTLIFETFYSPLNNWFEVRAYPSPNGLSIYFHNITKRKQSEQALLERARLATLYGDIGNALVQSDNLPNLLNRCAEALVEQLGVAFARIWTLNKSENLLELRASAGIYTRLDGTHARIPVGKLKIGLIAEERLPHLTNEVFDDPRVGDKEWARREGLRAFAGYPLIVEDRLVGVMGVFSKQKLTDLTLEALESISKGIANAIERKRIEEERQQLLTGEQEARRTAENANHLKDEFLATLSHELRTPLNAILGWSQVLQTRTLGASETAKALATIERSARSQNQLIEDLLDVSRIITGKLRLDVRAVDLSSVITAAVDAARPAAEAKNIRLQLLLDPQAGPISGDSDRLQQVVWNLLSNATKFTPKDGRIQVRLEKVSSHVEIVVSDTGKGIEPEFLPYVFDRFRQSDGSMTRRHGGLGLGLAIVRQLVELHGGSVSVNSGGSGQGAMFTVSLPLLPMRQDSLNDLPRGYPEAETDASGNCPPELADLRVLIVDDETDSRDLLNLLLGSCGANITPASSAAEALEIIKRERFDVVVSDIGMPEEDGFSLIGKIRELPNEQGGNVPAIALTAYARAEDRIQALRSGFQMHIAKPVEPSELIAVVANLAGRMRNPNRKASI